MSPVIEHRSCCTAGPQTVQMCKLKRFRIQKKCIASRKKGWFQNRRAAVRFLTASQGRFELPTWWHERRSHRVKWNMLLLTSDASPPTSSLRPSFMGGCKNVDWLQQAGSLYPPYHKIESRWRTRVHVALDGFFFLFFSSFPMTLTEIFLTLFFFLPAWMKARAGKGVLVWSHEEERQAEGRRRRGL